MRVLFVCTDHSGLAPMAAALLQSLAADTFEVSCAGVSADTGIRTEAIHPSTLATLTAAGIPASLPTPTTLAALTGTSFDYVIALTDAAHTACSGWPGAGVVMTWDFDIPAEPDPQTLTRTLQALRERIQLFIEVNRRQSPAGSGSATAITPVEFYKALADETRLLSLLLITRAGELCVCELMEALAEAQPKISRHLAQLRKTGVLLDRRQGQWVYYRLHPELPDWARQVLHLTLEHNTSHLAAPLKRLSGCC